MPTFDLLTLPPRSSFCNLMTFFCTTKYKQIVFIFLVSTIFIPLVESRKYSPVQLVLGAGCVRSTGVDERVDCCQYKALLEIGRASCRERV